MNFQSQEPYVDVLVSYALSYTNDELSNEFTKVVRRICEREGQTSRSAPIVVRHGPFDTEALPTNLRDGLWHFFGNTHGPLSPGSFSEEFERVKHEFSVLYVPFKVLKPESREDTMRLRVYQEALNIKAGRKLNGSSRLTYSILSRLMWKLMKKPAPLL